MLLAAFVVVNIIIMLFVASMLSCARDRKSVAPRRVQPEVVQEIEFVAR